MALLATDLRPGDLVLCYGWNVVAVGQALVKGFGALGTMGTVGLVAGAKWAAGDQIKGFSGAADCNHALVVGEDEVRRVHEGVVVDVCNAEGGAKYELKLQERAIKITRSSGVEMLDISSKLASKEDKSPTLTKVQGKMRLVFAHSRLESVPRICHSTGGGCTFAGINDYFGLHGGGLKCWRLSNDGATAEIKRQAAHVAAQWANVSMGMPDPAGNHYSMWKAFTSAFGSHIYGSNAKERAAFYWKHRETLGGPPSTSMWGSGNKKKEWFCSMFAIACFQAAMYQGASKGKEHTLIEKYLPLDAKRTTPMTLHGFVSKSSYWELVGSN